MEVVRHVAREARRRARNEREDTMLIGDTLGGYRVIAKLGEGGMGEVYRAQDTQLGRAVALKILPESFATDPDRLMRFEREARTLASLNHPHIAQIYGVERTSGLHALVMELVEGPTLADRLADGPLSPDEALRIARQIAEALEAAHEQGIIHRDLKPANIKVRPDGAVKVLDFGLAKATDAVGSVEGPLASGPLTQHSPTFTSPALTQLGVILGTAAYMSPEQAKGHAVDRRSDIWALGCLLCEMLTGRPLFRGGDTSEIFAAVLRQEIEWTDLPPAVPPAVRRLLRLCLARDPRNRLHDIADARLVIADVLSGTDKDGTAVGSPPAKRRVRALVMAACAAAGVLLGGFAARMIDPPAGAPAPAGLVQFDIRPPGGPGSSAGWRSLPMGGTSHSRRAAPPGTRHSGSARRAPSSHANCRRHTGPAIPSGRPTAGVSASSAAAS